MRFRKRYLVPVVLLVVLGVALGMKIESVMSSTDTYEQLKKLEDAYLLVNQRYVDEVEPSALVEEAIEGMLEQLDPHSSYISAEEIAEVQESYRGSFGGIGIWFEVPRLPDSDDRWDTARVSSTISGGPSEEAGVLPGDRIISVEGETVVGMNSLDIQDRLKGPIGTEVSMQVRRLGVSAPITIGLVRDRIPLVSVDNAYMMDDETGYVRITRFAVTTYEEFQDQVAQLREQGMQRLVVDLRDNPGGVMESAVRIADELLPGGQTIVYTKSRNAQYNALERSTRGGTLEGQPVIVLVNEYSASASEIVSGALQDHDRALIVGRRTFGKGLVQNQFQLDDGSVLQMTVSRYYTPSGRLIQTPYDPGDKQDYYEQKWESINETTLHPDEYVDSIADSLKYKTTHGRTVFGGGGIMPDVMVTPEFPEIVTAITNRGLGVRYARQWFEQDEQGLRTEWNERKQTFIDGYQVPEALWQDFWSFATTGEGSLTFTDDAEAVDPEEGVFLQSDIETHEALLRTLLKGYMARQLFGTEAFVPIVNPIDPVVREALQLWDRATDLAAYYNDGTDTTLGDAGN